jgi:hypothetical protein
MSKSLHYGTCPRPCGRRQYVSRSEAKAASRALYPGRTPRPEPCGRFWHIGPDQDAEQVAAEREQKSGGGSDAG